MRPGCLSCVVRGGLHRVPHWRPALRTDIRANTEAAVQFETICLAKRGEDDVAGGGPGKAERSACICCQPLCLPACFRDRRSAMPSAEHCAWPLPLDAYLSALHLRSRYRLDPGVASPLQFLTVFFLRSPPPSPAQQILGRLTGRALLPLPPSLGVWCLTPACTLEGFMSLVASSRLVCHAG